ncbi:hypothetical protein [Proteus hauseri]|uniref:hypothetical protein n=1 Tax=Proteus hauseri TaxID=183417 RepID=UPI0010097B87|nr:hypothetical protein [Proteus hauseri]QAV21882.1 hypothetical protein PH4a_00315 [Proteus hauseri]
MSETKSNTKVTASGVADTFYAMNISFSVGRNDYMLSLNRDRKYETKTLTSDGKFGPLVETNIFKHYYDYMQIIYDSANGKQYLCCISSDSKYFELFLIQGDGKLLSTDTHDYFEGFNKSGAIFIIKGHFYIYSQRELDRSWQITLMNA